MLILKERLSGSGGGASTVSAVTTSIGVTFSTGNGVSAGGAVTQPASAASGKTISHRENLITEPDAKYVDLR